MMPVRHALTILFAVLAAWPARAQEAAHPDPFVQVLTHDDLRAAGVFRLGDVFTLLDGWQTASTEGFGAAVSAGGLSPFGAAVVVLVDGQSVDVALFGASDLNALPLHVTAVERIEAVSVPTMAGGVFAPAGVLRIVTRTPAAGATVRGGIGMGNETGDPGPFRYTGAATPNVDRVGPNAWAAAAAAGRGVFAEAMLHADEHHATDDHIRDRVHLLYDEPFNARLIQTAAALRLGVDGRVGRHRLFGGYSRLLDLRFLEVLGRELPLVLGTLHAGVSGDSAPGRAAGVAYRVGFTQLAADPRSNRARLALDWREDRLRAHVAARAGTARFGAAVGAGLDHTQLVTAQPVTPRARLLARLDVTAHGTAGPAAGTVGGAVVTAGERVGAKAFAAAAVRLGQPGTVTLHASLDRRLPEERRDLWSWRLAGYRLPGMDEAAVDAPPYLLVGDAVTADLAYAVRPAGSLTVTVRGRFRASDRQSTAVYAFRVDSLGVGLVPAVHVVPDVAGRVVVGEAEAAWHGIPRLAQRLHYAYTRPFSDEAAFWTTWRPLAWHQAAYTARFTPNDRLTLWARARWTSSAYWPAYAGVAASSGGRYAERLPAGLALDVAVSKRFWGEHVHALLALRNALGQNLRSHPAGAVTRLELYVALRARFHGGG